MAEVRISDLIFDSSPSGDSLIEISVPIGGGDFESRRALIKRVSNALRSEAKTSDYMIVLDDDIGMTFSNAGAAGTVIFGASPAAVGSVFMFLVAAAHSLIVQANGADKIAVGITNSVAGGNIESHEPFSYIRIECHEAGQWVVTFLTGNWGVT